MNLAPIISILGLAPYLEEAQTIVTVSQDAYEAIKHAKAMLDSPEGAKFKQSISKAIEAAESNSTTSINAVGEIVHNETHPKVEYAAGQYVWDSFEGWVWVPSEG